MDYNKIYNSLIEDALIKPKPDSYKELHHIIPKCMGGQNNKENLVYLTARQHFLAHWLLYKIHRSSKLIHAWHSMCRISKGQEKRKVNAHLYEYCRKERSKILSENSKQENNNFFGKTHTEKTKQKLSNIHTGKNYKSQDQINNWIEHVAKKPSSEKHKKQLSERNKNYITLQNKFTLEKIFIDRKTIKDYDTDVWVHPKKLIIEPREKCVHCDVVTTRGNITRWHNDNCKRKNNANQIS